MLDCCLDVEQSFVVDKTNPTTEDRARYLPPSKDARTRRWRAG